MARPSIFADLSLDAAIARSKDEGRLLFVDATASWCGPCQVMDRTTWVDPAVVAAIGECALAVQIDVDTQADVAKRLGIKAMPTVVVYRDGAEIDRATGLKKPAELLSWLDGLKQGKTSLDAARAEASAKPSDMHARMRLARGLFAAGRLDEATDEYVWLWDHILEQQPAMYGVKYSFLVYELAELVTAHRPARDAFSKIRATVAPPPEGKPDVDALRDWFALNAALVESAESLHWYDTAKGTLELDAKLRRLLEIVIVPMLIEAERWADVGTLYGNPLASLAQAAQMLQAPDPPATLMTPEMREEMRATTRRLFRARATQIVRGLRAAGRIEEATAVAVEARKIDISAEMNEALAEAERA